VLIIFIGLLFQKILAIRRNSLTKREKVERGWWYNNEGQLNKAKVSRKFNGGIKNRIPWFQISLQIFPIKKSIFKYRNHQLKKHLVRKEFRQSYK